MDGDTSYYNTPKNIPVPVPDKEDRNNNDLNGYFTEKETSHDIISSLLWSTRHLIIAYNVFFLNLFQAMNVK